MIITFLFPNAGTNLSGGLKVVCEYANRLAFDGHDVHIAYAGSIFWSKKTWFYKMTGIVRYLQTWIKGYSCRGWFALDKHVKEHWCWSLNDRHVPQSDIYICTSPYTAMYLNNYRKLCKRYYFIQNYENWGRVTDEKLFETYHYPLQKFACANWLKEVVNDAGEHCTIIPNGFDFEYFHLTEPITKKDKFCISMLYHTLKLKGCDNTFKALDIVHTRFPQIQVKIFGYPEKPDNLPEWYQYYRQPSKSLHNNIYNSSSIYVASSTLEGWCLTIGEAMCCGCAVVCTDIPGYRMMAKDNETALLSPVGDPEAMAANIIRLIEDDALRIRIAEAGHRNIQQYTWDKSYALLKHVLFSAESTQRAMC